MDKKQFYETVSRYFETMLPVNESCDHIRCPGEQEALYHSLLVDQITREAPDKYRVYVKGIKYGYPLPGHGILRVIKAW